MLSDNASIAALLAAVRMPDMPSATADASVCRRIETDETDDSDESDESNESFAFAASAASGVSVTPVVSAGDTLRLAAGLATSAVPAERGVLITVSGALLPAGDFSCAKFA